MKRIYGFVFLCAAASCVAASAEPPPARSHSKTGTPVKKAAPQRNLTSLAPADEYFGPLKMSIIGIRNTIRDAGLRYDVNHDTARQTYASAQLTERSIRDWEKRFPRDDQLPRAVYFLQRLYTKVLTAEARERARVTATWLMADFNNSPQAKQLKKTLVAEHLAPLPSPTPAPDAVPIYGSIFGATYPSEFNPITIAPSPAAPSPAPARATAPPRAAATARPIAQPVRAAPSPARPAATPRATATPMREMPTPTAEPTPASEPATTPAPTPTGVS
ncbi:MAG: hypothetical protein M3R53_01355, partial [Candidatus Eremiobacteraeota bacterium]|nr:hypothetical protein [Candidatus Eremiobacteraeota bacterium]